MLHTQKAAIVSLLLIAGGAHANLSSSETTESSSTSTSLVQGSDSIDQIASQLTGTWKTTKPYKSKTLDDESTVDVHMMLSLAPISIEGMDNVMYVESVLSDAPAQPFRQSVFQLYDYKGKVRLRTYTIAVNEDTLGVIAGLTAAPDLFSAVTSEDLIPTLDIELEPSSSGFSGSTPYPYPTNKNGAVEMTSSVTFDGSALMVTDRGYDAQGDIVWGQGDDATYAFEKSDPYAVLNELDNGMVMVEYPSTMSDTMVSEGDKMFMHYSGYLTNGMKFDASYDRGEPYGFIYPPGRNAIEGWGIGMDGMTLGQHRKLIIPSELGYMERGNPRARIPGGSTLVFNIYLANLEQANIAPSTGDHSGHSHEGHDHSHHDGHDHSGHDHSDHDGHDHSDED